jgi:CheY-like chemotaxis protein
MLPNMRSDKIVPVILIVEDEALVRLSAVGMLEDAGFRTIEAANGDQALELLAADSCQSAFKFDPRSASNFDPLWRRVLTVALAPSELVGVAETGRARVVG